jgi:hypothetical protein
MKKTKGTGRVRGVVVAELARALGTRRAMRLRGLVRDTGLPPETLLDLALELLDIASRRLSPPPLNRTAVELGAARWRNVSPEARSEAMRSAAQARWSKHRTASTSNPDSSDAAGTTEA